MHFTVPFVYVAIVKVKPNNPPTTQFVRDSVRVSMLETDFKNFPIAMSIGDHYLRFDGYDLWKNDFQNLNRLIPQKITANEVIANTRNHLRNNSPKPCAAAPFKNFWQLSRTAQLSDPEWPAALGLANQELSDPKLKFKSDIEHTDWIRDNRQEIVDMAHHIANERRILNGIVLTKTPEPHYEIHTFGQGFNDGATIITTRQHRTPTIPDDRIFAANELEQAIHTATRIATDRRDTYSLPITVPCEETIKIHNDQAIKLRSHETSPSQ